MKKREKWKISITKHGPALFDGEGNCHGSLTTLSQCERNGSVREYLQAYCEKKKKTTVYLDLSEIIELLEFDEDNVKKLFFFEKRM